MQAALTGVQQSDGELEWFVNLVSGQLWEEQRRAELSDADRRLVQLVEHIAMDVAGEVLASEDEEDFAYRLDHVASRGWFLASRVLLAREVAKLGPSFVQRLERQIVQSQVSDFLEQVLGEEVAEHAMQAERLLTSYARALAALVSQDPEGLWGGGRDDTSVVRRMAFSITVPAPLRYAVQGSLRADACLLTVSAMAMKPSEHSAGPWLRRALAESLAQELYRFVALLASVPGSGVPPDVVPPEDRLDLEALDAEQRRLERGVARIYDAAAKRGTPYAPFGEPLLDD